MNQINIRITDALRKRIEEQSRKSGVPKSEMIRRGIEMYLAKQPK
jgi:predicted DNA-binding protein